MTSSSNTVANLGVVGITQIAAVALNQIVMIVLARMLGPGDFGLYAICLVFVNLLTYVSTLGLDAAAIHRQTETEEAIGTATFLRFVFSVVLSMALVVLAPVIAEVIGNDDLVNPLRVAGIAIIVAALGFETAIRLSKDLRFRSVSVVKATNIVVWSITALVLAYLGFKFWSLLLGFIAGVIASTIVLWLIRPWSIFHKIHRKIAREMLRYGAFSMGTGLLALMVWNFDKLAVGAILGSSALVGAYYIAFSYGTIVPNLFTGVVGTVMFPTFSRMQNDIAALRSRYLKSLKYISYLSIPAGTGLAVISRPFVLKLLGSEWSDAVNPLIIMSSFGILSSLVSPAGSVFLATGNPHRMFRQTWVMTATFFVLLIPAIYYWKLDGVALLFLVTGVGSTVWVFLMVADILNFSLLDELRMFVLPIIASAVMAALCLGVGLLMGVTLRSLAVQVAVGILTYVVCMFLLTKGEIIKEGKHLLASARK